jgi:hypothetical protein
LYLLVIYLLLETRGFYKYVVDAWTGHGEGVQGLYSSPLGREPEIYYKPWGIMTLALHRAEVLVLGRCRDISTSSACVALERVHPRAC